MRKILIHGPNSEEKLILSYPALHQLKKEFPESELVLAAYSKTLHLLKYLEVELKVVQIPLIYENIFHSYRFAENLKELANINCFIDFESTFTSSILGRSLATPVRIGINNGISKILYSTTIPHSGDHGINALHIVEGLSKKQFGNLKITAKSNNAKVDDIFIKEEFVSDYILIVLDELAFLEQRSAFFKYLFDAISGMKIRFIYFDRGDLTFQLSEIKELYKNFSDKNKYEFGKFEDEKFLLEQIIGSKGVISNIHWPSLISSYYGVSSISLQKGAIKQNHFTGEFNSFHFNEGESNILISSEGEIAIDSFIDKLHKMFRI